MRVTTALTFALVFGAQPAVGQEQPVVITGVTVIDGTGRRPVTNATVVVRQGRIVTIERDGAAPAGVRVIDGRGKYLLPGLIEMHAHTSKLRGSSLGLFVANGVTTVRDLGGDHQELLQWRREIRSGERTGPRLLIAGPYLESGRNVDRMRGTPVTEMIEPVERTRLAVRTPERARQIVDSLADLELDFLKVRTVQDSATYRALVMAAHARGLRLVGHVFGIRMETLLEAGHDGIEHFLFPTLDSLTVAERAVFWRSMAAQGMTITPTLVTFVKSILPGGEYLRQIADDSLGRIDPRRRYLSKFVALDWQEQALEADDERRPLFEGFWRSHVRNVREMYAAGVPILTGSDAAIINIFPGSTLHDELRLFVDSIGMSPMSAIESATRRSAEFLGIADSIGTIEAGKVADMLLLDADPVANVDNIRSITGVFLRGRYFDRAALRGLLAEVDAAPDQTINDWPRHR